MKIDYKTEFKDFANAVQTFDFSKCQLKFILQKTIKYHQISGLYIIIIVFLEI